MSIKKALMSHVYWRVSWRKDNGSLKKLNDGYLHKQPQQVQLNLANKYFRLLKAGEELAKGWCSDFVFDPLDDPEVQKKLGPDTIQYLGVDSEGNESWEEL